VVVLERAVQVMSEKVDSVATKISELLSTLSEEEALEVTKHFIFNVFRKSSRGKKWIGFRPILHGIDVVKRKKRPPTPGSLHASGAFRVYRKPDFTARLKEAFRLAKNKALTESPMDRTDGG
jgi:hypothetical protein